MQIGEKKWKMKMEIFFQIWISFRLAHKYLERHEAKVSRTHLWKEEMARQWKKFKRWFSNVSIYLIPWEARIKRIESKKKMKFIWKNLENEFWKFWKYLKYLKVTLVPLCPRISLSYGGYFGWILWSPFLCFFSL